MEKHLTFPVRDCYGMGKKFSSVHGGIDLSWYHKQNEDLLAVKSGKIVWSENKYYGGNVIALEVPYSDNFKQWVLYQHCKNCVSKRAVKQGECIGTMGDTGAEVKGAHLHFTMVQPVPLEQEFDYQWSINHVIDPYEHILYRLKGITYDLNQNSVDLAKVVEFTNDDEDFESKYRIAQAKLDRIEAIINE